jgi:glycosyltransferase involved in cell wall biosynthesis
MTMLQAIAPPHNESDQTPPFWSVMIPTYQPQEAFLRKTLESVLQQDPGADQMQIEVVDDCSTDMNVAEIVKAFAGARVKVTRTSKNLGLAGCWNTCIGQSLGKWVHILHHDDYVLPGFYERLRKAAELHPKVALVASRSFKVDSQGTFFEISPRLPELEEGGSVAECFFYANPLQCPGVVMRRGFYETHGGFREDLVYVLDVEMWARAVGLEGGVVVPEVLACFRTSQGQTTTRLERTGDSLYDVGRLIRIYSERYPAFNHNRAMQGLCEKALDQARFFSKAGDTKAAEASWNYWIRHMPTPMRLRAFARRLSLTVANKLSSSQS